MKVAPISLVEARELLLHRLAQMHVEIGERLVEQHDGRLHGEAARERDALALAAGQLVRPPLRHRLEPDHGERRRRRGARARPPAHGARAARRRRSRRRSCAATAHRTGTPCRCAAAPAAAPSRRGRRSRPPSFTDAAVGHLEAGDQPQQRGLAAARRTEQREEFAVGDREARRRSTARVAPKRFDTPSKRHARHGTTPSGRLRPSRLASAASDSVTAIEIGRHRRGGGRIAFVMQEEHHDAERLAAGRPQQRRDGELVERGHEDQQRAGRRRRRHHRQDDRDAAARSTPAPATCAASSRLRLTSSMPAMVGRSASARKRAR